MLAEELGECGYGDIERVPAIVLLDASHLGRTRETSGRLKVSNARLGLGIDSVLQGGEYFRLGVV